jgi:hypothetical protein
MPRQSDNSRVRDHQRRSEAAENTRRCGTGQPVIMRYDEDEDEDEDE